MRGYTTEPCFPRLLPAIWCVRWFHLHAILHQVVAEETVSFVVCAQFTGEAARYVAPEDCDLYLGSNGRWTSRENAMHYPTRAAAELALQEKWQRLRNSGSRSIILSVLKCDV